jgi:hypothetical protein
MPKNNDNRNVVWGCGLLLLLGILLLGSTLIIAVNRSRQEVHYPGAVPLSNHANYRGLPTHLRWDNTYLSTDPFNDVYRWYSIKFELGAEARALGSCITLEGPIEHAFLDQTITVIICGTPRGRMIYVSRSAAIPEL